MYTVIRLLERHELKILSTLVSLAVALGLFGFYQVYILSPRPGEAWNELDVLYSTLRMFALDAEAVGGSTGRYNIAIHIARLLAPVVLVWALVRAGLKLLDEDRAKRRLRTLDHHTIVVGGGSLARRLSTELCNQDDDLAQSTVLVVLYEGSESRLFALRERGICTLMSDPLDHETWHIGRLEYARRVFLVSEDEAENERLAHLIMNLCNEKPPQRTLDIHVALTERLSLHVDDALLTRQSPELMVHLVDPLQVAARHFFSIYPTHAGRLPQAGAAPLHLLFVGFTEMGQHLLAQAIRVAHYLDGHRTRITIVDDENQRAWRRFLQRTPGLAIVADVHYVDQDPGGLAVDAWQSIQTRGNFDAVYITLEDRTEAIILAERMSRWLSNTRRPVYFCALHDDEIQSADNRSFHVYAPERSFNLDRLARASLDVDAQRIHAHYLSQYPDMGPWHQLTELNRNANRDAADHADVVGAILQGEGLTWVDVIPGSSIEERLAELEHRRWMASKVMAGFEYGPQKDAVQKTHPLLVPYSELPESEKEKDRANVRLNSRLRERSP